jgi:hypothetical protein
MNQRILELAVEELERQRAEIIAEIEAIRAELRGSSTTGKAKSEADSRRRPRSAAQKKAQSEKMKVYWAKRLQKAGKKNPSKPKANKAAAGKAISSAMRVYWAKRKAESAAKTEKAKPATAKNPPKPKA